MTAIELRVDDLDATLHLPDGPGPHPAIVGLHPANGPSRDLFHFLHLARTLPPIGVAVLRFDRRPGAEDRFDVQCKDALAMVDVLQNRPEIDSARIGLWGYSQGAWVAPLAASRSEAIAFVIVVAACGVSPAEQMRYGTAVHLRRNGHGEPEIARMLGARSAWESFERGVMIRSAAQDVIAEVTREPWFPLAFIPLQLPPRPGHWPTMDFDPAPVLGAVRVPVLAFFGETDEWVPVDASVAAWERAGIPDLTIVRLAGVGHGLSREGRDDLDAIDHRYTDALRSWLASRVTAEAETS